MDYFSVFRFILCFFFLRPSDMDNKEKLRVRTEIFLYLLLLKFGLFLFFWVFKYPLRTLFSPFFYLIPFVYYFFSALIHAYIGRRVGKSNLDHKMLSIVLIQLVYFLISGFVSSIWPLNIVEYLVVSCLLLIIGGASCYLSSSKLSRGHIT